jgi:hypothetical protein
VPDALPLRWQKIDAVIAITLAQRKDGTVGKTLECLIDGCIEAFKKTNSTVPIVFANRLKTRGIILNELMEKSFRERGVPHENLCTPPMNENLLVRNTYTEAQYMIRTCKKNGWTAVVLVGNHLHMRRVLATFQKVMEEENYPVALYRKSIGRDSYGLSECVQPSFAYPFLFFLHEVFLAFPASIVFRWCRLSI